MGYLMHGLYVEQRSLDARGSLAWDLARHMYARSLHGKIAVVTDRPAALMAATRRQWMKLTRQVQRERSSTLNAVRITELSRQIAWMQNLTFSAKLSDDWLGAGVTFATADDFVKIPPACATVYVTYSFQREKLHMLTSWMQVNGLAVLYE